MRKTKRFGVGGMSDEEGKKSVFSERLSSDESKRRAIKDYKPEEYKAPRAYSESSDTPTKRIITKEQVEAKGFTNLRDFLNDERKLKRKDGKPVERAKSTSSVSGDDLSKYYANQKKPAEAPKPAAAPKKESAADVTAEIDKNVKSKGFEDALSYALPVGAAAAAGTAAYKLGGKGLLKKLAEKFAKPAEKVAEKVEPYIATKTQEAARKGVATKARRAAAKKEAEAAADEARMGGEGGGFKRGGKIRRFAAGGEVAAKKTPEPPIPKATQESMKRQAAQAKIDRKQAEEQKAGEKEVRDNMGRIGFKKGGSASRRADGCAVRGKTRA
jgi:hypothetical protein